MPFSKNKEQPFWRSGDFWGVFGCGFIIVFAGFLLAYQFVAPAPPERITIATGGDGGAYYRYGNLYRGWFAKDGIDLVVKSTKGSVENLELLQTGVVDIALVQGGVGSSAHRQDLESLGSLYFEPLWIYTRPQTNARDLRDLRGRRVAIGAEGSGTRALMNRLLAANEIDGQSMTLVSLGGEAAAEALLAGEVDAATFVAGPAAPVLQKLNQADDVALMPMERADGYAQAMRFLTPLALSRGALDFALDRPEEDITLLAAAVNVVVRRDFHPALVDLFIRSARKVHGQPGLFQEQGMFPTLNYLDFPINEEAERYFRRGDSFLQRYLPFWAANMVDRLLVLIIPLITLMLPFIRIFPPVYRWRTRSRIYRWYREVRAVELALVGPLSAQDRQAALQELDRVDSEVAQLNVPLSYADEAYSLRFHIDLVRNRIREEGAADVAKA